MDRQGPWGTSTENLSSVSQIQHRNHLEASTDCLSCRLTGATALTASAAYVLYASRKQNGGTRNYRIAARVFASGTPFLFVRCLFILVLSQEALFAGLIVVAIARLFSLPPFPGSPSTTKTVSAHSSQSESEVPVRI